MIYQAKLTVPKETAISSPLEQTLLVNKGLMYRLEIYIPSGQRGVTGIAVFDGLYQLAPTTPGEFFQGDGIQIIFDDVYFKLSVPYEFIIKGYNLSDTYEHSMFVRVGLVSNDILMSRFLPALSYEKYQESIAALFAEQEAEKAAIIASPWV